MPLDCYLEGVFAVDMVIRLDGCDDITGQRDAAEHRLLSAVYKKKINKTKNTDASTEDRVKNIPTSFHAPPYYLRHLQVATY